MKRLWRRFLELLTPGVQVLVLVLTGCYAAALVGRLTRTYDLYFWLALTPSGFWHGRVWQVASYPLLPASVVDFLLNGVALVWLGNLVERAWSRGELWSYALICALGAGLVGVVLLPGDGAAMTGTMGVVMGFLAAWARLYGHEQVEMPVFGTVTIRTLALALAGLGFLMILVTAGLLSAVLMTAGGLTGWIYLGVRFRVNRSARPRAAASERIGRLEL